MIKVCLDPGHGGSDPGAVNGRRYEKDDVLRLALAIKPLLEAQGVQVLLTRQEDAAVTIANRCAMANKAGCSYLLSLHRDAAGPAAYGVSIWVHSRANEPTMAKGKAILDEVLSVTPTYNRGCNKGTPQNYDDFGINVQSDMASALLELGFVTNEDDNRRFDTFFSGYAEAIAKGLCKAVGVTYKNAPTAPETPQDGLDYKAMYESEKADKIALKARLDAIRKAGGWS